MLEVKAENIKRVATLDVPEVVTALAFSPDGGTIAVGSGDKVHFYQVIDPKKLAAKQSE
jgi:acetyl-CoA carboxylase alpha subunit